jgi:hypothetical protein
MARFMEIRGGDLGTAVKGTNFNQQHVPPPGEYMFILEAEPLNKADPNAVAVLAKKRVGYLPREIAGRWSVVCQRLRWKRFVVPGEVRLTPDGHGRWILLWLPDPIEVNKLLI